MSVSRSTFIGLGLVAFAGVLWLYWPSLQGGFLRVDDLGYLQQSMRWNGLTWKAVKWAFTITGSYYQPLPRLSHVLDYQIWGANAVGHHASSVILHGLNAVLVFGFLWTLLGATSLTTRERLTVAWAVAVVFGIHPLQTESVAWMSGRTQMLCTTFGIGSLWAYVAGARRWVVWGLYVLAVMCKPMAVSLPFVMLAIDYFPLRRHEQFGWGRLVREKAALVAVAVALGGATMITYSRADIAWVAPLSVRAFRMFQSLAFYPWKLVWPTHLSPTYPFPWGLSLSAAPLLVLAPVLSVVIITAVVVRERRRLPMLAAAWGAYVMLVLPSSGLISPTSEALALRHAYVAMLPLLLLAGGAVVWLLRRSTRVQCVTVICLLTGQLCVFAARTRQLIPDWHNDETVRRATLVEFPNSEEANRGLATELLDQGRGSEALPYAQRAVDIAPQVSEAHMRLGQVLGMLGRPQEAIEQHEQALRINPNSAMAKFGLGVALCQIGKPEDGIRQYEEALRIDRNLHEAHYNLGNTLLELGKVPEAIEHYQQALRIEPDHAEAQNNMGVALVRLGRVQEAIEHYQEALRIKPDFAEAQNNMGEALVRLGRVQEAIEHYQQALRIEPDHAEAQNNMGEALGRRNLDEAHYNLGNALVQVGRLQEAIEHYQQALRIKPDFAEAQNNMGVTLVGLGRVQEAIEHYQEALRIKPDFAEAQNNMGEALIRLGRVQEAVEHYQQALRIKPDFARAQYNLGNALEATGKLQEAIIH